MENVCLKISLSDAMVGKEEQFLQEFLRKYLGNCEFREIGSDYFLCSCCGVSDKYSPLNEMAFLNRKLIEEYPDLGIQILLLEIHFLEGAKCK